MGEWVALGLLAAEKAKFGPVLPVPVPIGFGAPFAAWTIAGG